MVSMVDDPAAQDDELDVDDPEASGFDDGEGDDGTQDTSGADPVAELRTELGEMKAALANLSGLNPTEIRRQLGQLRSVQSELDRLKGSDPAAAVLDRMAAVEDVVEAQLGALIESPIVDDQSKASLRSAQARITSAKSQREQKAAINAAVAEIQKSVTKTDPGDTDDDQTQANPEAQAATARVLGYAEAKGVDPARIPATAWALLPGETLKTATDRVKKVIDDLSAGNASGKRVAERRGAAGDGSPGRGGGAQTDMDKYLAWGRGDVDLTEKDLRALEKRLREQGEI